MRAEFIKSCTSPVLGELWGWRGPSEWLERGQSCHSEGRCRDDLLTSRDCGNSSHHRMPRGGSPGRGNGVERGQ